MKMEHFAINVPDSRAFADWYSEHLGLRIIRAQEETPYIRFLADDGDGTILEVYTNSGGDLPDYANLSPLTFHMAFAVEDIEAECARLIAVGATEAGEVMISPMGDKLGFVRDPWGIPIQLAQRTKPLVS